MTSEEEEPPKQITSPKPKPTRMSEQTISKTITSPKPATATRTQQGWSLPSPKTETYADKVKMSKKPLDVKFNLTPLGFTTKYQRERQKKTEWIQRLSEQIDREKEDETIITWYTTKQVIKSTLLQVDMYITSTDMDNNKDRIKLITNKDQEAIDTIWEFAQNTTKKLNEKKKNWIQAFGPAIEKEFAIQTDDWPDFTRAWDKSLKDIGIRVPTQDLREHTPWNLDESVIDKPDLLDKLWNIVLQYAKPEEEATQQTASDTIAQNQTIEKSITNSQTPWGIIGILAALLILGLMFFRKKSNPGFPNSNNNYPNNNNFNMQNNQQNDANKPNNFQQKMQNMVGGNNNQTNKNNIDNNERMADGIENIYFLRQAKGVFLHIQSMNNPDNLTEIAKYLTPALYNEIKDEMANNLTIADFSVLNCSLVSSNIENNQLLASVEFNGMVSENPDEAPKPFNEIWNFIKPDIKNNKWLVAGIQQKETPPVK